MKNIVSWLALVVAVVALGFVIVCPAGQQSAAKQETAFDRVMRTRTIRCAYTVWPPHFMIDPNTKEKSGIDYEVMEAIGRVTNLKIDWQAEVGIGVAAEQLQSGKQDVFCAALWENGRRAQRLDMSRPIDFMPLYAYVREENSRFDGNNSAINNENASIAVVDGSAQKAIADSLFPKARQYSLVGDVDPTQSFLVVGTGKADVVFSDQASIDDYNAHNPTHKLRRVTGASALRIYGDVFSVAKGEYGLRDLLSVAINELQNDGTLDRILDKYKVAAGSLLRVAKPYVDSETPER